MKREPGLLYQVTLPGRCFGLVARGTRIVEVAPVGRWMLGRSLVSVCEWVARHRGSVRRVGA